jgi:hypothetical protein
MLLLLEEGDEETSFQKESLDGVGMQKRGKRSSPPLRPCASSDIPPEFMKDQEFEEKNFQ